MKKTIKLTEAELHNMVKEAMAAMVNEEGQYGVDFRVKTAQVWDNLEQFLGDDAEKWKEVAEGLLHWLSDEEVEEWALQNGYIERYDDDDEYADEYDDNEEVYSSADWKMDKDLNMQEGQLISPFVFNQLLNSVSPNYYKNGYFQPGEAWSSDREGQLYQTFEKRDNDLWEYVGLRHDMNNTNESKIRESVRKAVRKMLKEEYDLDAEMAVWDERGNSEFGKLLKDIDKKVIDLFGDNHSEYAEFGIKESPIGEIITAYSLDGNKKGTANTIYKWLKNHDMFNNGDNELDNMVSRMMELSKDSDSNLNVAKESKIRESVKNAVRKVLNEEMGGFMSYSNDVNIGGLTFTPCGSVTSDVINYVAENIDNFENRYSVAIDKAWKRRSNIRYEDPELYDSICELVMEYLNDNEQGYDKDEAYEDIDEVFD